MIKSLLRFFFINFASVYISLHLALPAVAFYGDLSSLLLLAVFLAIGNSIVKPLVNLFLLPFHLVTLGLFRWMANLIVVYLITFLVPTLKIHEFTSTKIDLGLIIIPSVHYSLFMSFILFTITITITFHLLYWLLQD
jgi:putative membrane protein